MQNPATTTAATDPVREVHRRLSPLMFRDQRRLRRRLDGLRAQPAAAPVQPPPPAAFPPGLPLPPQPPSLTVLGAGPGGVVLSPNQQRALEYAEG